MEFADIHTHILPEVDDGARTFEEAGRLLQAARESGVRKFLLTPHVFIDENIGNLDRIASQYLKLKSMAAADIGGIELHLGAELMIHPDLPEFVKKEKRVTVNGAGKYLLVEMPISEIPFYSSNICFNLLAQGIKLIWAHPERCLDVVRDYRITKSYADNGVLIQIDAGSLTGINGRKIKQTAETLVKKGLAHILASDVHRSTEAQGILHEAFLSVKRLAGEQKAVEMGLIAPSAVLLS